MRKSSKDSLKALEADIQFANTIASDYPRDCDGACLQMRLSYSPAARFFLLLVPWTDCHLAGALGLLRILIYKAYEDGKTTMSVYERKASLKEFYGRAGFTKLTGPIFTPSYSQSKQTLREMLHNPNMFASELFHNRYKSKDAISEGKISEIDIEREDECGICMEINSKVVLPRCNHSMCMKCYQDWHARSQSCPFCRGSLKRINSGDLWIYMRSTEIDDMDFITKENLNRLFMYIEKLPLIVPDPIFMSYPQRW